MINFLRPHSILLASLFLLFFAGCSKQEADQSGGTVAVTEIAECLTSTTYSSTAYITGTATFSKRGLEISRTLQTVTRILLSQNAVSTNLPIRYAEVHVIDGTGATVQCGKTDSSGQLKALDGVSNLVIPSTPGSYTVKVLSRSNTTLPVLSGKTPFKFYVSIKSDFTTSTVHSISGTVTSTGSGPFGISLNATHSEAVSANIEGAAFNIYNSILATYDYLAYNTSTSDLTCLNPKMNVFWKAGFNPGQYVDPEVDPSQIDPYSFYLGGYDEMYISGGRLGNVASQDTDHFDDSVIIHELGHRIEDVCGKSDSPGMDHNGQVRIDPRLAWSEGWGNYLGAHIIRNKMSDINPDLAGIIGTNGWLFYYDSDGYGSSGYEYIRINLARAGNSTSETLYTRYATGTVVYDQVSSSSRQGESHFREVSVARALFKGSNDCPTNCLTQDYFANYWRAFENSAAGIGLGKSIYPFRSSVKFLDRLQAAFSGTLPMDLLTMLTSDESFHMLGDPAFETTATTTASGGASMMHYNWIPYGVRLVSTGSTRCPILISPGPTNLLAETNDKSDQFYSNHFFWIDRNTIPTVTSITLQGYYRAGSSVDLDLIVLSEGYRYQQDHQLDSAGEVASNNKEVQTQSPVASRSATNTESVSISALSSSTPYLLNVRAYSNAPNAIQGNTEYSYTLTDQSGGYLCPATTF